MANANPIDPSLSLIFKAIKPKGESAALAGLGLEQWQALLYQADFQDLTPLLYQRLVRDQKSLAIPKEIIQRMADGYFDSLGRNLIHYNELNKLLSEFNHQNIQAILLKGIYLAEFIYHDIALRPMSDLDILVRGDDLQRAIEVVKKLEYQCTDSQIPDEEFLFYHHAPIHQKEGLVKLELHWRISDDSSGLTIDENTLWEHAQTIRLSGVEAMGLCLEELMLHICTHAYYIHAFSRQARSVVDLAEILEKKGDQINWEKLVEEARHWRAERVLFLMLYISHRYLEAPVPESVLTQLTPADFSPAMINDVLHLFLLREIKVSDRIGKLVYSDHWGERLRIFFQTVFPSRHEVSLNYPVRADSWKIFLFYPKLYLDRIKRQWRTIFNLLIRDEKTGHDLKSLTTIKTWLQLPQNTGKSDN